MASFIALKFGMPHRKGDPLLTATMASNALSASADTSSPDFDDDADIQHRVASNIQRQQANFERQDRLLAAIEDEIGFSVGRPDASAGIPRRSAARMEVAASSPLPTRRDAVSPGPAAKSTKLADLLGQNQYEGAASLAAAQRQSHLWKHEVDTQKRVIVELRDKIAELQRTNMGNEQNALKVSQHRRFRSKCCVTAWVLDVIDDVAGASASVQRRGTGASAVRISSGSQSAHGGTTLDGAAQLGIQGEPPEHVITCCAPGYHLCLCSTDAVSGIRSAADEHQRPAVARQRYHHAPQHADLGVSQHVCCYLQEGVNAL